MPGAIATIQVILADGENLWDKLMEKTASLGYTEEELVRDIEILAFIAEANNIWDFRAIPTGTLSVPTRSSRDTVIRSVRSNLEKYRSALAAVAEDRALGV